VAILTLNKMGGAPRPSGPCGCDTAPSFGGPVAGPSLIPGSDSCNTDLAGNQPVADSEYQCSIAVTLQETIDNARRISHTMGFRPYRVYLIWQERSSGREFSEVSRLELMPVTVVRMDGLGLSTEVWGEDLSGGIRLQEISPQQVTEDVLRGYVDGEDWAEKNPENREFFYEVQLAQRCADGKTPRRRRFYPRSEPDFYAGEYQFRISLTEQKIARSRDGVDQTIGTEHEDGTTVRRGPTLVT
jgi:hypothetical protein